MRRARALPTRRAGHMGASTLRSLSRGPTTSAGWYIPTALVAETRLVGVDGLERGPCLAVRTTAGPASFRREPGEQLLGFKSAASRRGRAATLALAGQPL